MYGSGHCIYIGCIYIYIYIYIYCIYTVLATVYIQFWPSLHCVRCEKIRDERG